MSAFELFMANIENNKQLMYQIDSALNGRDVESAKRTLMVYAYEFGVPKDELWEHITDIDNYLRDRFFLK